MLNFIHLDVLLLLFSVISVSDANIEANRPTETIPVEEQLSETESQSLNETINAIKGSSEILFLKTKITSGLFWEDLPPPTFYETFTSIVLEYKTPTFNKQEVTFNNWYNCSSESYPYALSCPIVFHLNSAIQNLHIDFESLVPGKNDQLSRETVYSQEDYFNTLTGQPSFCHRIQSHFPGVYTNRSDYEVYLNRLKSCSNLGTENYFYTENNLTDYNYSIRSPFSKMESNFYDKFYRPVQTLSDLKNNSLTRLLASAVLSNSRTALQGSLLGSFYAERNRWHFAKLSCQDKKLPANVVTETKFKSILSQLEVNLTSVNPWSTLSIPLTSLSKYFSLPLTDCTHTDKELVVRLLVPLTSTWSSPSSSTSTSSSSNVPGQVPHRSRFTLRAVHPTPFVFGDKVCKLKSVQEGAVYLYDGESGAAYTYNKGQHCEVNDLCFVDLPSLKFYGMEDECVGTVFSNNVRRLVDSCDWDCSTIKGQRPTTAGSLNLTSNSNSFLFQKVSNNVLILRKAPSVINSEVNPVTVTRAHLTCEHTSKFFDVFNEMVSSVRQHDGALHFEFKCSGCTLILGHTQGQRQDRGSSTFPLSTSASNLRCGSNNSDSADSFILIYQTLPWSLLTREKVDSILKSRQQHEGQGQSQDFSVAFEGENENWKSIVNYEFIGSLANMGGKQFFDGPKNSATVDHDYNDTSMDLNPKINAERHEKQKDEDSHKLTLLWTIVVVLTCLVILLLGLVSAILKKLRVIEGKSYFPKSIPERVSYRRASPILLMQNEEIMDGHDCNENDSY